MAYYRLYFLDILDHIQSYESFEAEADGAALERAALRETALAKELWCENRRLWRGHRQEGVGQRLVRRVSRAGSQPKQSHHAKGDSVAG